MTAPSVCTFDINDLTLKQVLSVLFEAFSAASTIFFKSIVIDDFHIGSWTAMAVTRPNKA